MQSTQLLISTSCFFSWLLRSGSWVFLVFLSLVVHNLPQLGVHAFTVIFSPLYFLCFFFFFFFCSVRLLSRGRHCSKGSQVPAYLLADLLLIGYCALCEWQLQDVCWMNFAHIVLSRYFKLPLSHPSYSILYIPLYLLSKKWLNKDCLPSVQTWANFWINILHRQLESTLWLSRRGPFGVPVIRVTSWYLNSGCFTITLSWKLVHSGCGQVKKIFLKKNSITQELSAVCGRRKSGVKKKKIHLTFLE